ncbi:MAG: lytic murein transglycosylase, partial [Mesorhizobium sp.]
MILGKSAVTGGSAPRHPLWPAGHLPLKGGDRTTRMLSPTTNVAKTGTAAKLPISPLEGEMPSGGKEG